MLNITDNINYFGTVAERAGEAIEYLKTHNIPSAYFYHNEIELVVCIDSTPRELQLLYQLKITKKKLDELQRGL